MKIDANNDLRSLFFIFQPKLGEPVDEVTIWLNGGPGCSFLEGFFQENGRFLWHPGTLAPVENPYSWVNLTNVLWYETLTVICGRADSRLGSISLLEQGLARVYRLQFRRRRPQRSLSNF